MKASRKTSLGFTLVELVVGMLVMGIAMVMLTTMLFPQADRAAFTLHRVRSAELAHSVLNEIWGKRYDHNTNANGGIPACGAAANPALGIPAGKTCTSEANLGPEAGESRNDFNDVDDYHGDKGLSIDSTMLNSSQTYASQYPGYGLNVSVTYPGGDSDRNRKLVRIDVTAPSGEVISYHAMRSNY